MMKLEAKTGKKTILSGVQAGGRSAGGGPEYLGYPGRTGLGFIRDGSAHMGAVVSVRSGERVPGWRAEEA